jgi:hypothetical protein
MNSKTIVILFGVILTSGTPVFTQNPTLQERVVAENIEKVALYDTLITLVAKMNVSKTSPALTPVLRYNHNNVTVANSYLKDDISRINICNI